MQASTWLLENPGSHHLAVALLFPKAPWTSVETCIWPEVRDMDSEADGKRGKFSKAMLGDR